MTSASSTPSCSAPSAHQTSPTTSASGDCSYHCGKNSTSGPTFDQPNCFPESHLPSSTRNQPMSTCSSYAKTPKANTRAPADAHTKDLHTKSQSKPPYSHEPRSNGSSATRSNAPPPAPSA